MTGEGRLMVVIWQSPGLELPSRDPADDKATGEGEAVGHDSPEGPSLHMVRPAATEIEEGSEVATVVDVMRDVVRNNASAEAIDLSKLLRRRLTKELSTIWHVAAGRDFVIEPAEDCRNFVLASFGKDMRIVCFQHEQRKGTSIDWNKVLSAIPWLLVVIACFVYMAFQTICGSEESSRGTNMVIRYFEENVCTKKDWETEVGMGVVVTMGVSFAAKKYFKAKQ